MSLSQQQDLALFMRDARILRKNIIMASEELSANVKHSSSGSGLVSAARDIITSTFGTVYKSSSQAGAAPVRLVGNTLLPDMATNLRHTSLYSGGTVPYDNGYSPAVFEDYGISTTLSSLQALYYASWPFASGTVSREKTFGLVSFSPQQRSIYLGADWRNFEDPSLILEAILSNIGGLTELEDPALPIELVSFEAAVLNDAVVLNWETSSESRSVNFAVEKLIGGEFLSIYDIAASGSLQLSNQYYTTDAAVLPGNTYTYRLRTLLSDGSYSYSSVRSVSLASGSDYVRLSDPVPNPVESELSVSFYLSGASFARLSLYDLSGREVLVLSSGDLSAGEHSGSYSVSGLSAGGYSLVLDCGNGRKVEKRVVVR